MNSISWVALRKESVDRNVEELDERVIPFVALRKESVDRNGSGSTKYTGSVGSLSARRAWIEIALVAVVGNLVVVALRKESVDRNSTSQATASCGVSRSPQGERG